MTNTNLKPARLEVSHVGNEGCTYDIYDIETQICIAKGMTPMCRPKDIKMIPANLGSYFIIEDVPYLFNCDEAPETTYC